MTQAVLPHESTTLVLGQVEIFENFLTLRNLYIDMLLFFFAYKVLCCLYSLFGSRATYMRRKVRFHGGVGWPMTLRQNIDTKVQLTDFAVHFARLECTL